MLFAGNKDLLNGACVSIGNRDRRNFNGVTAEHCLETVIFDDMSDAGAN